MFKLYAIISSSPAFYFLEMILGLSNNILEADFMLADVTSLEIELEHRGKSRAFKNCSSNLQLFSLKDNL